MARSALYMSSLSSAPGRPLLAKSHTRMRPHPRGDFARKLVITAGIFDGLLGGGRGAAKVDQPRSAFKDKVDLSQVGQSKLLSLQTCRRCQNKGAIPCPGCKVLHCNTMSRTS